MSHPSLVNAAEGPDSPLPEVEAEAKALFLNGLENVHAGDLEEGCFLFTQSLSLVPRITTKYNLADCLEKRGKKASALQLFAEVALAMRQAGDTARESAANERAAALRTQVCTLRVLTGSPAKDLAVRQDGELLEPTSWTTGKRVDSGTYTLEASAPGKLPWSVEVQVPVCPSVVSVKVPSLRDDPAPAAPREPEPVALPSPKQSAPSAPPALAEIPSPLHLPAYSGEYRAKPTPVLAYVIGGYGVISTSVGFVFLGNYKSKNDDAKAICPSGQNCTAADINRHTDLIAEARSARLKGLVGVSLGAAALGVGGFMFLSNYYAPNAAHAARWTAGPLLGADGRPFGALVEGRF